MKVLILTFYYPPDLCPGSFRAEAFVGALKKNCHENLDIEVLTTTPNRYESFHAKAGKPNLMDSQSGLKVSRIALPSHRSGFVDQAYCFQHYAARVIRYTWNKEYDLVIATSSRLMTAVLGSGVARRCNAKLYLDIRDIFAEVLPEVFPSPFLKPFMWTLSLLERWAVKRSDKVNLVSEGFLEYFERRYPGRDFSIYSNGVDAEFIHNGDAVVRRDEEGGRPLRVLYAGNIGDGQAMEKFIPQIAKKLGSRVEFKIIGDGGRKKALESTLFRQRVGNVTLCEPVSRNDLKKEYQAADILFLHLNSYGAFQRVLPSKLFEYASAGKPLWVGASGFAADFVRREIGNAVVFKPFNTKEAIEVLGQLKLETAPRPDFVERFSRETIMESMASEALSLLDPEPRR